MSARDVCDILEASTKAQVSVLKFNGLYVRFGKKAEPEQHTQVVEPIAQARAEQIARESLQEEAVLSKEERLALLQIEDPLEYEKLLLSGELEKDDAQS